MPTRARGRRRARWPWRVLLGSRLQAYIARAPLVFVGRPLAAGAIALERRRASGGCHEGPCFGPWTWWAPSMCRGCLRRRARRAARTRARRSLGAIGRAVGPRGRGAPAGGGGCSSGVAGACLACSRATCACPHCGARLRVRACSESCAGSLLLLPARAARTVSPSSRGRGVSRPCCSDAGLLVTLSRVVTSPRWPRFLRWRCLWPAPGLTVCVISLHACPLRGAKRLRLRRTMRGALCRARPILRAEHLAETLFVVPGDGVEQPISLLPRSRGRHLSADRLLEAGAAGAGGRCWCDRASSGPSAGHEVGLDGLKSDAEPAAARDRAAIAAGRRPLRVMTDARLCGYTAWPLRRAPPTASSTTTRRL